MEETHSDDIFVWSDGSWCFRDQFHAHGVRNYNYRVLQRDSDEWVTFTAHSTASAASTGNQADYVPQPRCRGSSNRERRIASQHARQPKGRDSDHERRRNFDRRRVARVDLTDAPKPGTGSCSVKG